MFGEGNAQSGSDIIGQDSDNTEPQSDNSKEGEKTIPSVQKKEVIKKPKV